ncbi:hypothetical protein HZB07_03580 [Candidatus Saganbacteria bacterium]|nr:hypothetical protein [Candidatus Saganbacteria bacterium]
MIDDINYEPKIVLNLETMTGGLKVTCGSCTNQKGFLDWNSIYTDSEKTDGLRKMAALVNEWKSKGTKFEINCEGLTEEEIRLVEGVAHE